MKPEDIWFQIVLENQRNGLSSTESVDRADSILSHYQDRFAPVPKQQTLPLPPIRTVVEPPKILPVESEIKGNGQDADKKNEALGKLPYFGSGRYYGGYPISKIKNAIKAGASLKECAERMGKTESALREALRGRSVRVVNGQWIEDHA